ncbi:MAG: CinA family protein [Thermodesulfovibrio sp.]|uniref:CinA family protein n=1 Tax=unclassified Thermodesulfovibrio TaxID=2645936 RepID=UPI00083A3CB8|nr:MULTISPECIES: CinA family protein [unclassified Thermodesulfovibrio]MDI1471755.1 CinA family protein [Thermodesulfovibrio sp. 1176]MDI6713645.1 CinA family protein [Thermodesulfovibrio sp.]ODA44208.1 Molybdopterin binding motif, CinA N-terminal domain / C-terminal domain of CinA type S [Thermodesulfovibrio sp. N1]
MYPTIEQAFQIVNNLKIKNKTLSTAESCTGGLIASSITDIPGASKIFLGGVVVYATEIKRKILNIPEETFKHGVISSEMAITMALAVKYLTGSDYSIATTGNLGPDTMEEKPAGLIYIAVATPENVFVKELKFQGDRYFNKINATNEAFNFLIEKIV